MSVGVKGIVSIFVSEGLVMSVRLINNKFSVRIRREDVLMMEHRKPIEVSKLVIKNHGSVFSTSHSIKYHGLFVARSNKFEILVSWFNVVMMSVVFTVVVPEDILETVGSLGSGSVASKHSPLNCYNRIRVKSL